MKKYDQLVETFGTHYFEVGRFGGSLVQQTIIESTLVQSQTKAEVKAQCKAQLASVSKMLQVGASGTVAHSDYFRQHTATSLKFFGGNVTGIGDGSGVLSSGNKLGDHVLKEWFNTVALNPWLFSGKLTSIDELISGGDNLKKGVKKAINLRLARAALADVESLLEFVPNTILRGNVFIERLRNVVDFFDDKGRTVFPDSEVKSNMEKLKELRESVSSVTELAFK